MNLVPFKNKSVNLSTATGDCLSKICILELVIIDLPSFVARKSSTSCVIVVKPRPYFRARFAKPKIYSAVSFCLIKYQASSTINKRFFFS